VDGYVGWIGALVQMSESPARQKACILVLGMHRSGTSAMTRTINAMGAALPSNLIPPLEDNAEGFWESEDMVHIHNRFMVAVDHGWNDPRPLPREAYDTPAGLVCRAELMALLRRDFTGQSLFVIKDPRISVLMPIWKTLLRDFGVQPYVVLGFRHPDEVARSLVKRRDGFVDGDNRPVGQHARAVWLTHNLLAERDSRALPRAIVSYDDFLADPVAAARSLAERLGCFDAAQVAAGLEVAKTQWKPSMRNQLATASGSAAGLPVWVARMYSWLTAAARGEAPSTEVLDDMAARMSEALELYGPLIRAGRPSPAVFKPPVLTRLARRVSKLRG